MEIRVAIVEDDRQERLRIRECLTQLEETADYTFRISDFCDGKSFLQWYSPEYDLILMDIMMPDMNGMETAMRLREMDTQVALIFVTNMAQFAIQGYEVQAMDYILKPINKYSFAMKLKRAIARTAVRNNDNIRIRSEGELRLYAIVCCLLIIVIQYVLYRYEDLRLENMMVNRLWQEDKKHFEQSKEVMDAFNIKYHDLRHKLSLLKSGCSLDEIEALCQQAEDLASNIRTGNDAMDVLLTECGSTCAREGIELTYMGRGADLSFMETVDVYSLFGNALENAIEAIRKIDDPEKKIIHITTERRGDLLNIEIVNYYTDSLRMENSLPTTTKGDNGFHGFGMKSMQLIAQKYGGEIRIDTDRNLFELCIVLMAP